ncbi:ABC transporter permease [Haloplanus rallus]|jgi:spermidine/putrescine transport system permease protein|uniref:ABC transporter permease n=1 Tax=Haloplanus rallus TaxID=1816183 RepID=A0A6B9F7Y4_9EURY|nr:MULTISPECIES: ABC transporter permease [Haloplanus]QGX95582.1 ABC transporter permease [Haloplanus rallus]
MSTQSQHERGTEFSVASVVRFVERNWIRAWSALVFLFLYAPIIVLIVFSFERGTFSTVPWDGFTFRWYRQLAANSRLIDAAVNSLYVGAVVTTVATVLGTLGAVTLVRYDFKLKSLYRLLVVAPMTIPGLILGVALLNWFNYIGISTSLKTVMIGQLVFVTPFVLITVTSRLRGFDPAMEEAARDLGASRWQAYRRVTLPILMPGIVSGALFAFTLSFDDFLIAFFTSGVKNTLPIYIWSKIQHGTSPVINAISTLVLLFSISLVLISYYFTD